MEVKEIIKYLGLVEWTHVCIRCEREKHTQYLGGGTVSSVVRRFGTRIVKKTLIGDEKVLVIYVE